MNECQSVLFELETKIEFYKCTVYWAIKLIHKFTKGTCSWGNYRMIIGKTGKE